MTMRDEKITKISRNNSFNRRNVIVGGVGASAAVLSGASAANAAAEPAPKHWDMQTDVVVVGYGGAGAVAAIAAHDADAQVLILEKQAEDNHIPNTRMAGGIWHSPDKDGDRAALKQYAIAMMSGDNVPGKLEGEASDVVDGLAEVWASDTPGVIDFLKSIDPDFKAFRAGGPAFPKFPGAVAAKYRTYLSTYTGKVDLMVSTKDKPKNEKMNGEAFFTCLKTGVANRKIRILYGAPAEALITNSEGVIGVTAVQNGRRLHVKARRGVVLTTGGFEYNPAMRRAFLDGPGVKGWTFWGTPANTGDGIAMAMTVGAALAKVADAAGGLSPSVPLPGRPDSKIAVGLAGSTPNAMIVDNYGNRYTDEGETTDDPGRYYFYHKAAEFDQKTLLYPRAPSWMIFDETYRSTTTIALMGFGAVGLGYVPWTKDNLDAIQRGWILKADTIEELAAKIKAQPDNRSLMIEANLGKAVSRFNGFCANHKDEDFGRRAGTLGPVEKPPFYAMPLYVGGPNTKGGIAANARREVLDWNDKPIQRLYTAGEISSAFKFVYQAGGNLTECVVFGRIAGRNAAAEKPWV
jgi:3-oxosteroid 1-dehydrogenase